ncbi:WGR domain-containing protein [Gellertiella hungarica]|uniref:Putative DNA-binding WGR domain protein n=1 Tax=Gellertiella hungarica TaxID=1572859 RepID=A0A7W6NMR1_9HYPH|nr:WGR domain-containing protein [Gellertiella hungarica]MBB4066622.1 putative DNA-binding WGR domain protein [Gellertiella hungarica]
MKNRFQLHLQRIDPRRNMQRFYALSIEKTLLGEVALIRRWGRIGTFGRQRVELFGNEGEALRALLLHARLKRLRHYRPAP